MARGPKAAAGKFPAQGKLMANLSKVTPEERARAGITDEMANAMVASNQPKKTGVVIERGPFQASAEEDVVEQVRVIDHGTNETLWAGSPEQFAKLKRILGSTKVQNAEG